jgi:type I restriction enzyme S subunit
MNEWAQLTLAEVCEKITDGSHQSPQSTDAGKPMASVKDLTPYGITVVTCRLFSEDDFLELKRQGCSPKMGDVLIAKDGNSALDTVCVFDSEEDIVLLSSVAILRPKDTTDPYFLRYYLDTPSVRDLLKGGYLSGSAIPRVILRDFKQAPILIPEKKEQIAIGRVLKKFDDKIELNQKMNQTLEEIAKAIFKSWFVDFDPVRAKAESRPTGLPPEISDLFPDELVDSEIGEIPKGWDIGNLKSVSSNRSKSVKPDQMANFSSYVGLEHLPRGHIFLSNWGNPSEVESNKTVFEQGDILFGKLRPYFEKSVIAPTDGVCSTDIVAIEPNANTQIFVACLVSQRRFFDFTSQGSTGTRMPRTSWKHMCEFEFSVPADQLLQQFQSMISPLVKRAMIGISESEILSELRDTLLPKLISGELRIPDAEKFLEEAGI